MRIEGRVRLSYSEVKMAVMQFIKTRTGNDVDPTTITFTFPRGSVVATDGSKESPLCACEAELQVKEDSESCG